MSVTISIDSVAKSFGRSVALGGVSFDLEPGITGLLGPNGAGKTTLLRMLATVLAPDVGAIRVLGNDPADPAGRLAIRRALGYLPQDPGFYPRFTAFDFVDYVAILKEMNERRARHDDVRRVLDLVGLTGESGKRMKALSGGMRRRVGLAQALLGEPRLLVLDEPTAGLDPEQRLKFREIVSMVGDERTTVLSTHQTEDVAALCSKVIVLHQGVVRFNGTPPDLTGLASGRVWVDEARDPRARLAWRGGDGNFRHIGDPPVDAQLVAPTIEDGYLLLVGESTDAAPVEVVA